MNEFSETLDYLQNQKREIIIAGDYNIDLLRLKEKPMFNEYFDSVLGSGFFPKITLPTRLSNQSGTLIDNFLCKLSPYYSNTKTGVPLSDISDNLPYFISLNQTVNRKTGPTFKTIRDKSISAINNLQVELQRNNLSEQLDNKIDADPELNYNTLIKHIHVCQSVQKCLPRQSVKFNKHKHKKSKSKWITNEIVRSIASRDRLYAKLKSNSLNSKEKNKLKSNLKTCNALLSKRIREAKKIHYHSCFNKCRHNIKKQWSTIKDILISQTKIINFQIF